MWLLLCLSFAAAAADAPPLKTQPIPFSHKTHTAVGQKCLDCHPGAAKEEAAGFPPESRCMACHVAIKKDSPAIQKLAAFAKEKKPVPWVRVYKIPEYVWFSHESHVKQGGVECSACHGQVAQRDVLTREKSVAMKACMDCHEERGASNTCNFCHNPG